MHHFLNGQSKGDLLVVIRTHTQRRRDALFMGVVYDAPGNFIYLNFAFCTHLYIDCITAFARIPLKILYHKT